MKKLLLTSALSLAAFAGIFAQPNAAKLDSLMNYYASEYQFNGVALISYKGQVVLEKGYGYRSIEQQTKNNAQTMFEIGSNTKQFTAEVILMLAKEGKLNVDDKLTKYFPDYPSGNKIKLKNLLTHTSGIYNYTDDSASQNNLEHHIDQKDAIAIFEHKPLLFKPGEKFSYSNSNYILLGCIIEQVTGEKYEAVVRKRIFEPIGMTHTGFDYMHLADANKASGYYTIQGDVYTAAPLWDSSQCYAAGGMYSNTEDILKWLQALQNNTLLPKEWQDQAFVPYKHGYGYGWMISNHDGKTFIGHTGGVPGFASYESWMPADSLYVVIIQNCEAAKMDNNSIFIKMYQCIYDPAYKIPEPPKRLDASVLSSYTGVYNLAEDFDLTVGVKDGQLYVQGTGQPAMGVEAVSETKFECKAVGAEIEFKKDKDGHVNELVLTQNGGQMPGKRKS